MRRPGNPQRQQRKQQLRVAVSASEAPSEALHGIRDIYLSSLSRPCLSGSSEEAAHAGLLGSPFCANPSTEQFRVIAHQSPHALAASVLVWQQGACVPGYVR